MLVVLCEYRSGVFEQFPLSAHVTDIILLLLLLLLLLIIIDDSNVLRPCYRVIHKFVKHDRKLADATVE